VRTPRQRRDGEAAARRKLDPCATGSAAWTPFHTRLVLALGVAWVLDGLEITIASSVAGVLGQADTLHLSATAVGAIATIYLVGEVVGALVIGRLSDRLGRRNLFMVTLGVYLVGSGLTALTLGHGTGWITYLFTTRFIAGTGIGGEYAAINSAIDEMIPVRYRGRVDIGVNGIYWAGAILGTLGALVFLHVVSPTLGWRLGVPARTGPGRGGPGRAAPPAGKSTLAADATAGRQGGRGRAHDGHHRGAGAVARSPPAPVEEREAIEIRSAPAGYRTLLRVLFATQWRRSVLGATLMITQSFLYNAILFTYALVLTHFYGVSAANAPIYLIGFAAGNLLGPLTIGRLFDTVGRKQMITGTYVLSGALLGVTAYLFDHGVLTATAQTLAWCVIFFFASAGANAAYLTVSEIFPLEVRAQVIAVFFAIAQCFGVGPVLYGHLIGGGGDPSRLCVGYLIGGAVMVIGGIVELVLGVPAERKPLEAVARPLSVVLTTAVPRAAGAATTFSPGPPPRTGTSTSRTDGSLSCSPVCVSGFSSWPRAVGRRRSAARPAGGCPARGWLSRGSVPPVPATGPSGHQPRRGWGRRRRRRRHGSRAAPAHHRPASGADGPDSSQPPGKMAAGGEDTQPSWRDPGSKHKRGLTTQTAAD
jgi:MFS family permease